MKLRPGSPAVLASLVLLCGLAGMRGPGAETPAAVTTRHGRAPAPDPRDTMAGVGPLAPGALPFVGGLSGVDGYVGLRSLAIDHARNELYVGGSSWDIYPDLPNHWHIEKWDSDAGTFVTRFISRNYFDGIVRLMLGDVEGSSEPEVILLTGNGTIHILDGQTREELRTFQAGGEIWDSDCDAVLADVLGDPTPEIIIARKKSLHVYDTAGHVRMTARGQVGAKVAVGQMDDDPAMEIATPYGVYDAASRKLQWSWPSGFGGNIAAADVDGDGRDELLSSHWSIVSAFDVERQLPSSWSATAQYDIDMMSVADGDGDGTPDLLLVDDLGVVEAFELATGTKVGSFSPGRTNGMDAGDMDGDGETEIVWGMAPTGYSTARLYMGNPADGIVEWRSVPAPGSFRRLAVGTFDDPLTGSRFQGIVAASAHYYFDYLNSLYVVIVDAASNARRAVSEDLLRSGPHSYRLTGLSTGDLDGNGTDEILVGGGGWVRALALDPLPTFTQRWMTGVSGPGALTTADLDRDGRSEVIVGQSNGQYEYNATVLYVLDPTTGTPAWNLARQGYAAANVIGVVAAQMDLDPATEIAVLFSTGEVLVVDGDSHAIEASLQVKKARSIVLSPASGSLPSGFAVEVARGKLKVFRFSDGTCHLSGTVSLGVAGDYEGFALGPGNAVWVAQNGRVTLRRAGVVKATTENYGRQFGRWILPARLNGVDRLVVSGPYGLFVLPQTP